MGISHSIVQRVARWLLAAVIALTTLVPATSLSVSAAPGDERSLYLHYTHTGKTAKITFRRNGQYDRQGLRDLNTFLADWRTKEATNMDPALFDLLWSVYRDVGATQPIHIVSSYRSPKTNKMLASRSSGVADNSQHMKGKAIDFFIPGIKLATLRESVMRHQVGGIGYYPTSGSPFVHADTGSVRAWPRMTRAQLKKVFPDGKTLHLPTDGKPISSQGRAYAEAEWRKCKSVPCKGVLPAAPAPTIMMADIDDSAPTPLQRPRHLFGSEGQVGIMTAALQEPSQREVTTFAVAPAPLRRPGERTMAFADASIEAPVPARRPERLMVASVPGSGGALEAIDSSVPKPRVLMTPRDGGDVVAAYAPGSATLEMLIQSQPQSPIADALKAGPGIDAGLHTASLGGDALKGMFDMTFNALAQPAPSAADQAVREAVRELMPIPSIEGRQVELVAPEMDHVNETLTMPVLMSDAHFAELYEAEGYLDKQAELGPLAGRMNFLPDLGRPLDYDHFVTNAPLLVASR